MMSKKSRHKARTFAIQSLYQWHFNPSPASELIAEFQARNDYHTYVDWALFAELIQAFIMNQTVIDEAIIDRAARPLKEINPMELAILRTASTELKQRFDVPYQVVLSEYVDLTQEFGAETGHQFINAVLDRLSKQYRPLEQDAKS
ncbi:MAG: transcription antitermination factor NusB [Gammaproteobacteria bacterium]|nr:transcription antitermination factor NusB [Gammaproteobacteria bacterium]